MKKKITFLTVFMSLLVLSCQSGNCALTLENRPYCVKYIYKLPDSYIDDIGDEELKVVTNKLLVKDVEALTRCGNNSKEDVLLFFQEWTVLIDVLEEATTYMAIDTTLSQLRTQYDFKTLHEKDKLLSIVENKVPTKQSWDIDRLILCKFLGRSFSIDACTEYFFRNGNPSKPMKQLLLEMMAESQNR